MVPSMDNIIDDGLGKFDNDLMLKRKTNIQPIGQHQPNGINQLNHKHEKIRNNI